MTTLTTQIQTEPQPQYKSLTFAVLSCLNAAKGSFFMGYELAVYNILQKLHGILLMREYQYSFPEKESLHGIITMLLPLGAAIGAFTGGNLNRSFDGLGIIGIFLTILPNINFFLIGRLIVGIAVGINSTIVPIFISETAPRKISGFFGIFTQLLINIGILCCFCLSFTIPELDDNPKNYKSGYSFTQTQNYDNNLLLLNTPIESEVLFPKFLSFVLKTSSKLTLLDLKYYSKLIICFPIIFCFTRSIFLMTFFKLETSMYYLEKNDVENAKKIALKIYKEEFVDEYINDLQSKLKANPKTEYSDLFDSKIQKRVIVGIFLMILQVFTGQKVVVFYSQDLFLSTGNTEFMAKLFTTFLGIMLILSCIISGKIIDLYGRKIVLFIGEAICFFCLGALYVLSSYRIDDPIKYISMGPIVWLYLPEILPNTGVSLSIFTYWSVIGFVVKYQFKIEGVFLMFFVFCFFGLLFIVFCIKETKGKSLKEIEKMFNSKELEKSNNCCEEEIINLITNEKEEK